MRALLILLLIVLLCAIGQLEAQSGFQCVTPSWVTTAPPEAWMPTVCSQITLKAYDASAAMQQKQYLLTVLGYWRNMVYAQSVYDPTQVWLIDHATYDANKIP